jgi:hypothetical protein
MRLESDAPHRGGDAGFAQTLIAPLQRRDKRPARHGRSEIVHL